jgi:Uncharacterized protein conserved in bacteria
MRETQINITPFNYVALYQLTINRNINEHAKADITISIKNDLEEQYMEMLSNETWVKITGTNGIDGDESAVHTVLFYGMVTNFQFDHDGYETILKLVLTSGTVLMDLKPHFRVFQNEASSCVEIHQELVRTYPDGQVICMEGSSDKMHKVFIQYRETDWEFLKRLASETGRYLIPDALKKGAKYTIGMPSGMRRNVQTDKLQMKLDMNEYMEKSQNGMSTLQAVDMTELILTDREIYQIGDSISYQGKDYYICQILTEYEKGECVHTYYCRTKEGIKPLPIPHIQLTGCSFNAVITNVRKDKVQVDIEQDEWNAADGKKWFLYATVYSSSDGTGWYCMPEIGDSVRLYVPDKEAHCFIMSAVHKETDGSRQNPDHKSFKTKYGKEILFTPSSILMTNNKGMMVKMEDKEGITISSDRNIVIQAAGNLTVSSSSDSLLIAAEDKVQVKQGSTTMTLSNDISFTGGEFRIQ